MKGNTAQEKQILRKLRCMKQLWATRPAMQYWLLQGTALTSPETWNVSCVYLDASFLKHFDAFSKCHTQIRFRPLILQGLKWILLP